MLFPQLGPHIDVLLNKRARRCELLDGKLSRVWMLQGDGQRVDVAGKGREKRLRGSKRDVDVRSQLSKEHNSSYTLLGPGTGRANQASLRPALLQGSCHTSKVILCLHNQEIGRASCRERVSSPV